MRDRFPISFQHPTSILLLVILGFLASFVEYSQAVPVASDPYHEEKLGRVKIQVRTTFKMFRCIFTVGEATSITNINSFHLIF